ncbi:hypothetical protein [Gemmiger formicilis]|uniref:hypothetical protein n=1 Tax=Gemmiger formicilis TaxID=745368 RepID=UPI0035227240
MEQVKSFCRRYRRLLLAAAYLAIFAVGVLYLRVTVNIPPEGDDKLTLNLWLYDFQRMPFWQYALQDLQGRLRYFTLQEVRFFPFHYPNAVDLLFLHQPDALPALHHRLDRRGGLRCQPRSGQTGQRGCAGAGQLCAGAGRGPHLERRHVQLLRRTAAGAVLGYDGLALPVCVAGGHGTAAGLCWARCCPLSPAAPMRSAMSLRCWRSSSGLLRRRSVKNALLDTAPALGGMGRGACVPRSVRAQRRHRQRAFSGYSRRAARHRAADGRVAPWAELPPFAGGTPGSSRTGIGCGRWRWVCWPDC